LKLSHVEAAVLVGGASSRMGRDKATLVYRGEPLALCAVRALEQCVERVRLVGKPGELPDLGVACIVDRRPERASLIGVHAALAACEASAVLVSACDLPEIEPRLVLALLALAPVESVYDAVAPVGPSGPEPLLAIYRPRLLPELERRIEAGEFALRALLADAKTLLVPERELRALDPELRSLRNLNRPEDL
jgi:molybdopterin-guanine dinucleotide biosynthesis protein A